LINTLLRGKSLSPRATSPRKFHTDSEREYDSYITPDSLSSGEEKIRLERLDTILSRRSPRRRIRHSESLNSRRIRPSTDGDFTSTNPEFLKLLEIQKKQSVQIRLLQQQLEKQSRLIQLQNELILSSGKQNDSKITAISKLQDQLNTDKVADKTKKVNKKKKTPKREYHPKKHASLRRNYQLYKRGSEFEDTESSSIEDEQDLKRRQEENFLASRKRLTEEADIKEAIKK